MKVEKEVYQMAECILDLYDPERLKKHEMDQIEAAPKSDNKWADYAKQLDLEEKKEEIDKKDFN